MIAVSVIIPTHNQVDRLRLVLSGLAAQTLPCEQFETLVVDDGCTDGTSELLRKTVLPGLRIIRPGKRLGRSAARNLGARAALGELLVFLDGDALPMPDLLATYWRSHRDLGCAAVWCGSQYVLGELEYLKDPRSDAHFESDTPSVVKDWVRAHRDTVIVTEEDARTDSGKLLSRATPGGYPFPESAERQRHAHALLRGPAVPGGMRWLGFIPHNGAIPRAPLLASGGFDVEIPFSEGWELAYRLQNHHGVTARICTASTIHLYHQHRFTDADGAREEALKRYRAIEYMVAKHEDAGIRLLYFWFASLWPDPYLPEEMVVPDLVACEHRYLSLSADLLREYTTLLDHHPILGHLAEAWRAT